MRQLSFYSRNDRNERMKIVLLKDVAKVGHKYDVKDVASGYALNFLIPHKLAETATPVSLKKADLERKKQLSTQKEKEDLLVKSLKSINGITVKMAGKTNDKGHLFAGIHKEALIKEIAKQTDLELLPEFIILEKPIKEVGEHAITVKVGDKTAEFRVVIKAEK